MTDSIIPRMLKTHFQGINLLLILVSGLVCLQSCTPSKSLRDGSQHIVVKDFESRDDGKRSVGSGTNYNASYRTAANSELWCVPGCALDADLFGKPVVPSWCSAWMEAPGPVCSENENGSRGCVEAQTAEETTPTYVCQRINLEVLKSDKSASTWVTLIQGTRPNPNLPSNITEHLIPEVSGLKCNCLLPYQDFGWLQRDDKSRPEWCSAITDGVGYTPKWGISGGAARRTMNPVAVCKGIVAKEEWLDVE